MSDLFISENGIPRKHSEVEAADNIIEERKKGDPWTVIDLLLKLWATNAPDDVEAMSISLEEYREGLIDKEFGATKGGKDHDRRFKLSIPTKLILMIRTQYTTEELPYNKEFYRKFAERYPFFKVSEKN